MKFKEKKNTIKHCKDAESITIFIFQQGKKNHILGDQTMVVHC